MSFGPERTVGEISIAREHSGQTEVPGSIGDGIILTETWNSQRWKDRRSESSKQGPPLERMLDIQEAAHVLGVHANTVRRWSNSGQLRAYRIGRRRDRRFKQEDISRFLEQTPAEPEE